MRLAGWLLISLGCLWLFVSVHASEDHDVILIRGTVEAAAHEAAEGFFNIGTLSVSVPRESAMAMHLKDKLGQTVELRLRVIQRRELQEVKR